MSEITKEQIEEINTERLSRWIKHINQQGATAIITIGVRHSDAKILVATLESELLDKVSLKFLLAKAAAEL